MGGYRGIEGLRHTLPDREQAKQQADRHQNARDESHEIAVKIAQVRTAVPDEERANERHGHDKAGRGRGDRKCDRRHLAEVGKRRFATIALPVGIRDEADCRVEGKERLHAGENASD